MLKKQQKDLFLTIIKKFIQVINEYEMDIKNKPENCQNSSQRFFWLKWVGERFEDFLLKVYLQFLRFYCVL